jgi:hypothetical protein
MYMILSWVFLFADCGPVQAAVALQSKTPFHAVVGRTGSKATDEDIWTGGIMYTKMSGGWLPARMAPENALSGVTGGVTHFSECRRLADDAIRGEPMTVYAAKMESGEQVQLWISAKSGLLARDVVDVQGIKVSADFDYANVRAPVVR